MVTPRVGALGIATAKGDLYSLDANGRLERLPVGADGSTLVADSSTDTGLKWIPGPTVAARIPYENDDSGAGFTVGSRWYSTVARHWYTAADVTAGAAVWLLDTFKPIFYTLAPGDGNAFTNLAVTPNVNAVTTTPGIAATSFRESLRRTHLELAAGLAGRGEPNGLVQRGNAAGIGGWFSQTVWSITSAIAGQQSFAGLLASFPGLNDDPRNFLQCIGVGNSTADANMQLLHNDGAGAATAIDLGASFPAVNAAAVYELTLYALPNAADVYYLIRRLDTSGAFAQGVLNADLPSATSLLYLYLAVNDPAAGTVSLEHMRTHVEPAAD